jgi:general secretion pathway protein I
MLAALTVLALCCAVLLTAFGQSAKSLQQVQRSDRLNLAARSLMDEFGNGPLHVGRSEGVWEGDLRWYLDVREQPSNTPQIALYRLDLNLDEGRRHVRFSTLQARSASSGAEQ